MMKKQILLLIFLCISISALAVPINKVRGAVFQMWDEMEVQWSPIIKRQHALVNKLNPTIYGLFFANPEQDVLKSSPETKQFLGEVSFLLPQMNGFNFCKECLEAIHNPNARDLEECLRGWRESKVRQEELDKTTISDNTLSYEGFLTKAFHEGDDLFEKRIKEVIREHSEEQN